ncbi:MAG: AIR carboxylase family protein, partial [archaeon]|nr:AIR carboxylase family protein [archaeon]
MVDVVVICGSKSDQHVLDDVCQILKDFQVDYDAKILSAHRNRKELEDYIMSSKADLFIAIAGLSAHLPGFIASMTTKPVIGVPVSVKLGGLDA